MLEKPCPYQAVSTFHSLVHPIKSCEPSLLSLFLLFMLLMLFFFFVYFFSLFACLISIINELLLFLVFFEAFLFLLSCLFKNLLLQISQVFFISHFCLFFASASFTFPLFRLSHS